MTGKPPLLLLVQRIPFPPDKGEKIRSYNIVRYFAERYDVYLGTCIDDPADVTHIETLRSMVCELHVEQISKVSGWAHAVLLWLAGAPLSFGFFRRAGLGRWVKDVMARVNPKVAICFSSNIMHPLMQVPHRPPVIIADFVDVDSQKWRDYVPTKSLAIRWIFQTEARRTHAQEAQLGAASTAITFVTDEETALFAKWHPELAAKSHAVSNGVDLASFNPDIAHPKPDGMGNHAVVFTGRMDYWPNVDAVVWFAHNVMPKLRQSLPDAQFYIVGGAPNAQVQALANQPGVIVTGRVPDVQPFLQHGLAAVAPMQIARGIQNKVLEALAMAKPTIVSQEALTGVNAPVGEAVLRADTAAQWHDTIVSLAHDPAKCQALSQAGRSFVASHFAWSAKLARMEALLG
jgi:polysaccharide biosynthesis protein PslH